MQIPSAPVGAVLYQPVLSSETHDSSSAVSWPAILGGTFATVALSLVLFLFGAGMGFAFVSPLAHEGMSAVHVTWVMAAWLIFSQWVSAGLGGYLTGRLRTKWAGVHTHEVFFRDTAHGFLTWAVATVVGAVIVAGAASTATGGLHINDRTHAQGPAAYDVDNLFRTDHPGTIVGVDQDTKAEVEHILMRSTQTGILSSEDNNYLTQTIAEHTGLPPADTEKKIEDTLVQMRITEEQARKAAGIASIMTLLSMLIGAFIASVTAAIGGQERDMPYPQTDTLV